MLCKLAHFVLELLMSPSFLLPVREYAQGDSQHQPQQVRHPSDPANIWEQPLAGSQGAPGLRLLQGSASGA